MVESSRGSSALIPMTWSRRAFVAASLSMSASALAKPRQRRVPRVLFVCRFGTAKSAIAREIFRRRASERGVAVTALSRGITPEDHMTLALWQRLSAEGIDPTAEVVRALSPRDWQHADIVVIFSPLPPKAKPAHLRDWTDTPSVTDDYANARFVIDRRIDALLDEIAQRSR